MEMSRLTRDGTAEPVSRDQILRQARGQGNINFPCSADDEQDWQPYPVDPYSAICDDHTYIHTAAASQPTGRVAKAASLSSGLSPGCDHVPDWQPRILLGMVEARSVNVALTHSQ